MPQIVLDAIPQTNATGYPPPFDNAVRGRWYRRLAPAVGLSEFGVSHVTLKPGAWSSQRHWHEGEDEFVVIVSGEAVLVEDDARTVLRAGDCAAFPKGVRNGHHLVNEATQDCVLLAIGGGERRGGGYADIDMMFTADGRYTDRAGRDYGAGRVP